MESRMCPFWFGRAARSCVAFIAVFAGSSAAMASCGDRPGTPNDTRAEAKSSTSIEFSWRNTTGKGMNKSGSVGTGDQPHQMYFDIYVRDAQHGQLGKDQTGTGPFRGLVYGIRSSKVFDGLLANKTYCFAIRARTAGGTQGCISAVQSGWSCTTTLAANAPTSPHPQPPAESNKIVISVVGKPNNTIDVTGHGFKPNARVAIRVTNSDLPFVLIETINNQPIMSSATGTIAYTFTGLCKKQGPLYVVANDGRSVPTRVDIIGTLWSNTVTVTCT